MNDGNGADITVAARVSKPLYAKILKRQRAVRQLTGIEPSVSAVVRLLIEEATNESPARQHVTRKSA